MLMADYGCRVSQITTRNPQANAILERIHQTIGSMIRCFMHENIDEEDLFSGLFSAIAFATRATIHTTLNATPMQLVFGRDAITNNEFTPDWDVIRTKKQKIINENNAKENAKQKPHTYQVGDKVLLKTDMTTKYGQDPYVGPYTIVQVNDNGTIRCRKNNVLDTVNIRNVHPHKT